MAVATSEHSVDALHAFFDAEASFSDRLRDEVRGFVSLAVGCEHWRYEVSFQGNGSRGCSPGLTADQKSLGLFRTPTPGRYEQGEERNDQERKDCSSSEAGLPTR